MNVAEEATSLCPLEYCASPRAGEGVRAFLRDTRVLFNQTCGRRTRARACRRSDGRWADFGGPGQGDFQREKKTPQFVIRHLHSGRIGRFERWLARVGGGGSLPELDYIHMFLPHEPREFLPDGRRYVTPDAALEGPPAYDKKFLSQQEQQRVQLQLGYTDRVVGQVIARLKKLGLYDDAFVVVVADHGESFDTKRTPAGPFVPGHLGYRRAVTPPQPRRHRIDPDVHQVPEGPRAVRSRRPLRARRRHLPDDRGDDRAAACRRWTGRRCRSPATAVTTRWRSGRPTTGRAGGRREWQRERKASLASRLRLFGSGQRIRCTRSARRPSCREGAVRSSVTAPGP